MSDSLPSAFELLLAAAKARAVDLARDDRISLDDARYLLRAFEDLEADGVDLFSREQRGARPLHRSVEHYVEARVGLQLVRALELVPTNQAEVS